MGLDRLLATLRDKPLLTKNLHEITTVYREDVAHLQDLDLPPEVVIDTVVGMQAT